MEAKIREALNLNCGGSSEDNLPDKFVVARQKDKSMSLYKGLILSGIHVDRFDKGFISCSFTVPRYLTNRDGNFANGAIANLVDELGSAVLRIYGDEHFNVSVDMSISLISTAKLNDELEMISRVLGQNGRYSGTIVLLRNKKTGDVIAEGRHSLFGNFISKI
ncbi:Thioesterase superfamily protein [Zostera marina]|uniref:Acyl-coenzyme A thioesterase 13 n=1 Tax=Zostera marina TaxID=29655 RepID=A0A0K9PNR4_ZOSMR|nr:Thioesterase superfamily protein [Zostera marina]